ncbi:uncharacterized protein FIBRA_06847 [Fibroporia radiculosa]|uniref:Uncharacterized protein n=1 Tax=Fibroporia radiculosa TaxID=599839 RepID=J4GCP0_9APHY|nr:uncharacterized protein FIBRA_06847 [Fibroporia radiculosa]CCM04663.1 predicted protein [Fibroporia radiculosa]
MSLIGPPSIEELIGGLAVSIDIAILLYGIVTAQAYFYWWTSQEDSKLLRSLVASVWFLETMHTLFCIHMAYYYTIISFGDMNGVRQIVWSAAATGFIEVLIVGWPFYLANLDVESKICGSDLHTDSLVRKSMAYIINTGALTMCVTMAIIATFWAPALRNSLNFAGLVEIQSKREHSSDLAISFTDMLQKFMRTP